MLPNPAGLDYLCGEQGQTRPRETSVGTLHRDRLQRAEPFSSPAVVLMAAVPDALPARATELRRTPVLFVQRSTHRSRQRDTVLACPRDIEVHTTLRGNDGHDEFAVFRKSISTRGRIRAALVRMLVPVNVRRLPVAWRDTAMLVYSWGFIPLGTRHGMVIECDTPYVLSLYGITWFRLARPVLRRLLLGDQCVGIVCISEACRTALLAELGPTLAAKAHVVYPVPPMPGPSPAVREADEPLRLLFVSTQFILKGGRELLSAVRQLVGEGHPVELTMVTNVEAARAFVRDDEAYIRLIPASMPREQLRRELFGTAHVLVHPTMQDSFGMVLLEALSCGLPIVTTDLFAADEMVQPGRNGTLVEPPVRYYATDKRAVWSWWGIDVEKRVATMEFPAFATALADALRPMLDETHRRQLSAGSSALFTSRFAPEVREVAFLRALGIRQDAPSGED